MYYGSTLACDEHTTCAEVLYTFVNKDVPRDSSCLFNALIVAGDLKCMALKLRAPMLNSPYLQDYIDPIEEAKILSFPELWGDSDCIRVFSRQFQKNVCVHFDLDNGKTICARFIVNKKGYTHISLKDNHYKALVLPDTVTSIIENAEL